MIKPIRPSVTEMMLDTTMQMLRAETEAQDKPIAFCNYTTCYVLTDSDLQKIKRYILELEDQCKK